MRYIREGNSNKNINFSTNQHFSSSNTLSAIILIHSILLQVEHYVTDCRINESLSSKKDFNYLHILSPENSNVFLYFLK